MKQGRVGGGWEGLDKQLLDTQIRIRAEAVVNADVVVSRRTS